MNKAVCNSLLSDGWEGLIYHKWDFSQDIINEWDNLAEYYGDLGIFISYGWFESWWHAFGEGLDLCVIVLKKNGFVKAIFPCCIKSVPIKGIEGNYISSLTNDHTCHYDFIIHPEYRSSALSTLLKIFEKIHPGKLMYFEYMLTTESNISCLNNVLHCKKIPVHRSSMSRTPWIDVSNTIEDFMQRLPGKFKYNLRRRRKKAESIGELKLEVNAYSVQIDALLDTIFEIEHNSWKGKNGTAIKCRADVESFYRLMSCWAMKQKHLLIFILYLDNKPVAADLCLHRGGSVFLLKQGYDEAYQNISPGKLLRFDVMNYLYRNSDIKIYNLLGDCEPWKMELTHNTHKYTSFRIYTNTIVGWSRYVFSYGWKTFLKKIQLIKIYIKWKNDLINK